MLLFVSLYILMIGGDKITNLTILKKIHINGPLWSMNIVMVQFLVSVLSAKPK